MKAYSLNSWLDFREQVGKLDVCGEKQATCVDRHDTVVTLQQLKLVHGTGVGVVGNQVPEFSEDVSTNTDHSFVASRVEQSLLMSAAEVSRQSYLVASLGSIILNVLAVNNHLDYSMPHLQRRVR